MADLNNLFNPKSIAIVGASEESGKVGNVIAKNILELGYAGEVFLVNPKHQELFGKKCYGKLQDIEDEVDLAIIAIPAKLVADTIAESAGKIKNYAVISAGFSEIGKEGNEREKQLSEIAQKNNLNILGPNCLGFIIPKIKLNASFAGGMPEAGNISLISQSGALAVAIMDIAHERNMKFSSIISIGNKMQLDESVLLEYLINDEETKVVGMYLEGIKDGKKFMEVARKISKRKPVVILKSGKTEKSQKAISSHTGALAVNDEVIDAVFNEVGVLRAENIDEFLEILKLISITSAPKNEEAIIITNAGGLGVLATDAFKNKKIKIGEISKEAKEKLRNFLPEESSIENPIDLLGDAGAERYQKTLEIISQESADSIICLLTPQDQTPVEKIAEKIINFKKNNNKNVMAVFMGGERVKKGIEMMTKAGIPNYFLYFQAVNALDKYYQWSLVKNNPEIIENKKSDEKIKASAKIIMENAKKEGKKSLLFSESKKLLELYGINVVESLSFSAEEKINDYGNFPAVVKVDSEDVLHKTEKKGVMLNINNQKELKSAVESIQKNFPNADVVIQPMAEKGTELIIGLTKDNTFGPLIVFGLGGIYTNIFKIADFIIPPADNKKIEKIILEGKTGFLFQGARNQTPYNAKEVEKIISGISQLALDFPEIKELDINPLIIYNNGGHAVAVDIKVII